MSFAAVLDRLQRLENPYPGLRAFEPSEAHLFFGRDQQIGELLLRLERSRLVAVVGVSGSGKSSLIQAGLIPTLERGGVFTDVSRWRIVVTRPSGAPFLNLAEQLSAAGFETANLRQSSFGLIYLAQQLAKSEALLVVVDQFEELFRYKDVEPTTGAVRRERELAADEAREYVQLLITASRNSGPVYVVMTMRSDYLGDCAEFRDLPEALSDSQYLVPRLTREQRRQAIEYPLGPTRISPALVQRMLNDVGDEPDQLPILQHALMRTWNQWRESAQGDVRGIEIKDYELAGGFEDALNQHAEKLLNGTSVEVAAIVFKRLTARGRKHRERRDPAILSELWGLCGAAAKENRDQVTAVIEHFRQPEATFLQPRKGELRSDTYVDIAHESLIRHWKKLRDQWLPEETESVKTFFDLIERARNWKAGRGELLAGLDLSDALAWSHSRNQSPTWATHYTDEDALRDVLSFLDTSVAEERRRERKRKLTLWLATGFSILFAALMSFAIFEWRRAEKGVRESKARDLAAYSNDSLSDNPERAILLAMESVGATVRFGNPPIPAAEESLHEAILTPEGKLNLTLQGHAGYVNGVAFSPDGKLVATVSADSTAKVWDAASGKELLTLRGHKDAVVCVAFSPDGKRLATVSKDQTAKIWDVLNGQELLTIRGHTQSVNGVAFSPNGKRLATASADKTAKVWDAATGQELLTLHSHTNAVTGVAFSPDGKRLATSSADRTVNVWDAASGKRLLKLRGHTDLVLSVAFSPDGRRLATASADKTAKVWDAATGQELKTLRAHTSFVTDAAFSPDGRRLVTASYDLTAKLWDASSGQELLTLRGHNQPIYGVAFSPDGKHLATASCDQTAKVWDTVSEQEIFTLRGHDQSVNGVTFSSDGKLMATASSDQTVKVWDASTGQELVTLRGHDQPVLGVAFGPHSKLLATASSDAAKVWEVASGKEMFTLHDPRVFLFVVGFSPDGKHLAIAGSGGVQVWDWANGQKAFYEYNDVFAASGLAFSPDGEHLAIAGAGGVEMLNTANMKALPTWSDHNQPVNGVTFSPDGKHLATASSDGAEVWDVASGRELLTLRGHQLGVHCVAFSPDGKSLATASDDRTAKVWDAANGKELLTLRGHTDSVNGVAFSPDGKRLATAGSDGLVQIFALDFRDLLNLARSRITRNPPSLTDKECRRYFQSESCPPLP